MLSRRLFTLSLLAACTPLWAKPQRMRIVVPYPAGGPLDAAARITAESIKSRYGRVIVENRAGAAGARAMLEVKNAASDGMTLAVGALATLVVNPLLFNDLPYSPKDFSAVCLLSDVPNVLVMSPKTMQRLGVHDAIRGNLIAPQAARAPPATSLTLFLPPWDLTRFTSPTREQWPLSFLCFQAKPT